MCLGSSDDRRTTEVAVWVSEVEREGSRKKSWRRQRQMEEKNNFVRVRKHKKKDHANYLSPLAPMAVFRLCFFHLKEEVCETLGLMCSSGQIS